MDTIAASPRAATNRLFGNNRLKLGTFATNVSNAAAITKIEDRHRVTWPAVAAIAKLADDAGFEAMVPVARWRGFGGEIDFNGTNFETYTWAAGLAALTRNATLFSTSHVPTIHPIVAAKQATTIDHISGGRFALNIVCGWFQPEFEMFGAKIMDHETRYAYAAEWIEVVRMLWTRDDEFDFEGKYFKIVKGYHRPKPIQQPFPALMNAGSSETGRDFAARHCDIVFTAFKGSYDEISRQVDAYRTYALRTYGREIQLWVNALIVQDDSEAAAQAFLKHYVDDYGDWDAVDNMFRVMGLEGKVNVTGEALRNMKRKWIAGWNGLPCIGDADQIADELGKISATGVDGCVVTFPRYEQGLRRFTQEVVPLLVQAGLRAQP